MRNLCSDPSVLLPSSPYVKGSRIKADRAWGSWLSVCDCLSISNNSQEDKTCYINICAKLKNEERASDIAQLPPKIADLNARCKITGGG